jgi:cell division septal protein FtsQ
VGAVAKLADVVVLRLPRARARPRELTRLLPSWRVLAIAFGALLAVAGSYLAARQSALFAVQTVEITGAPPTVSAAVRDSLRPLEGESLLTVDLDAVANRLAAIPSVQQASFDRAFPHTLRVVVVPEQPVAIMRRGAEAWLVSSRGRVIRRLNQPRLSSLPRVWVPTTVTAAAGDTLADASTLRAVRALAAASAGTTLPARVSSARSDDGKLTLVLAAGTLLELGDEEELALKLAVARHVLLALDPNQEGWPAYVDLTVPGRPVVGNEVSQVESET